MKLVRRSAEVDETLKGRTHLREFLIIDFTDLKTGYQTISHGLHQSTTE